MNPVVSFKNVTKSYGHDEVLKKISFDVQEGDVVALIGQSGSGKSTALRCINGLETINGGELQVCGRNLHDENCDIFGQIGGASRRERVCQSVSIPVVSVVLQKKR